MNAIWAHCHVHAGDMLIHPCTYCVSCRPRWCVCNKVALLLLLRAAAVAAAGALVAPTIIVCYCVLLLSPTATVTLYVAQPAHVVFTAAAGTLVYPPRAQCTRCCILLLLLPCWPHLLLIAWSTS